MTINVPESLVNKTSQQGIFLLEEIFSHARDNPEGISAVRFRADNYNHRELLDKLSDLKLLTDGRSGSTLYRPTLYALPLLDHPRSSEILSQSNSVLAYLQSRYKEHLEEAVPVDEIAYDLGQDYSEIAETFLYMRDGDGWFSGCSLPFPYGEDFPGGKSATIHISEAVLRHSDFDDIINKYYQWSYTDRTSQSLFRRFINSLTLKPGLYGISINLKKFFSKQD